MKSEDMDARLTMMTRGIGSIARHEARALGLSSGHRLQRHGDGSYTLTIRLAPEGVDMDVGGVDGVVISQHRSMRPINRREIEAGRQGVAPENLSRSDG